MIKRVRYWATSKDTKREDIDNPNKAWLEFNPNLSWFKTNGFGVQVEKLGMWRINTKRGVPIQYAGYNPHKKKLIEDIQRKW